MTEDVFDFVNCNVLKNITVPWEYRFKVDPEKYPVKPVQILLAKYDIEDVITNLGKVLRDLAEITPNLAKILAVESEEVKGCIAGLNRVFGELLTEKNLVRGMTVTCQSLLEVLRSKNRNCVLFTQKRVNDPSVLCLLVNLFKNQRDFELLTAAQLCILNLVQGTHTWEDTVQNLLFEDEEDSSGENFLETLRSVCYDENSPVPTLIIERMVLLTCWTSFCQAALDLKEELSLALQPEEADLTNFFQAWNYFSSSYDQHRTVLNNIKLENCFKKYSIYTVLADCAITDCVNLLLSLNLNSREMGPPLPLNFLESVLNEENGLLYLVRCSNAMDIVEKLTQLSELDEVDYVSFYHPSLQTHLASDLFSCLMNGFKIFQFCDKLAGYRSRPHHAFRDPLIVSFLNSFGKEDMRRDFSKFMGKKLLFVLLDIIAATPEEGTPTTYLQIALFLLENVIEEATETEFWTKNFESLFLTLRKKHLQDIKFLDPKEPTTLAVFSSRSFKESPLHDQVTSVFETAFSKIHGEKRAPNKSQLTCIYLLEAMLVVEHGRYKVQLLHEMVISELEKFIKESMRESLQSALTLFQSGMSASAPEQSLVLRYSLPCLRLLGNLMDISKEGETAFISRDHLENVLKLWTVTLDLNGQIEGDLALRVKKEIVAFLKTRVNKIIDKKTVLSHLMDYGTSKPMYYPSLLEILLTVFPEPLPLLITGEEREDVGEILENHKLEVEKLKKSYDWEEKRTFGELLLCSTPYVKNLVEEFFKRISSYQSDDLLTIVVRAFWKRLVALTAESSNTTTLLQAMSMTTLSEYCLIPQFSSSLAKVVDLEGIKSILKHLTSFEKDNDALAIYQSSFLDVVLMLFTSKSSEELVSNGCGERIIKALLKMGVAKEQSVEVVNKTMETLWELADQSKTGNQLICSLLPKHSLHPIFARSLEETDPSFSTGPMATVSLVSLIAQDNAALVRSLLYNAELEDSAQAIEKLLEDVQKVLGDSEKEVKLLKKLSALAKEGASTDSIPPPVPKIFPSEADAPPVLFQVLSSALDVAIEKRKRFAKADGRQEDLTDLSDDLMKMVTDSLEKDTNPAVKKLLGSGYKKAEPLPLPDKIEWSK